MSLTTAQAAELAGLTPAGFRRAMHRAREKGIDLRLPGAYPDRPLWDADALTAWLAARPGRGNWRKEGQQ